MNSGIILKSSFIGGIALIIAGAFTMSTYHNIGVNLLIIGIVLSVVFVVNALIEIRSSTRIQGSEKTQWTIGLLTMWFVVGWKYLLFGRRRMCPDLKNVACGTTWKSIIGDNTDERNATQR